MDHNDLVKQLVRVAQVAGQKDNEKDLFCEDPPSEERLGIAIRYIRQRKNISYEELAVKTHSQVEMLIALEAGVLDTRTIDKVLPRLLNGLGIDSDALIRSMKNK